MSVYQGSDAMVSLFDKVLVINGGHQAFYGKASEARSYFQSLGFICPERTTITDFLNSMTAEPALRHVCNGRRPRVPKSPVQFGEDFRKSRYHREIVDNIASEKQRNRPAGHRNGTYSLPVYQQVIECSLRQFRVLLSDKSTWMVEAMCIIVQSLVLGTLFRDQARATRSFFILSSSLFNSVLVPALQSMSEFGNTFAQRPLVIRQKRYRFYRPVSYGLGLVLTDAVWKIVAISYNIPQYFLTGFQSSADRFFTWFLIAYVEHMALSMVFRAIAVTSPNMNRAVLPVGLMFNLFVLYTGLYVPGPQMQSWLFWLKYCNVRLTSNPSSVVPRLTFFYSLSITPLNPSWQTNSAAWTTLAACPTLSRKAQHTRRPQTRCVQFPAPCRGSCTWLVARICASSTGSRRRIYGVTWASTAPFSSSSRCVQGEQDKQLSSLFMNYLTDQNGFLLKKHRNGAL